MTGHAIAKRLGIRKAEDGFAICGS